MDYTKLLFLLIISSTLSVSATNVRLLQQAEVNKKIATIESKMLRDKRILLVLTALGHVQNIYVFWSLIAPQAQAVGPICEACKTVAANAQGKEIPFLTAVWSGLAAACHNTKNLFTTRQGWLTIGQCGLYYGSLLSASLIVARMADDLIHPDTLRWYMNTYAPYELTIGDIKEAIVSLQDQSITQDQIAYNTAILKSSLNRLARYGESLCAYMVYKMKHLDDDEKPLAEKAAHHLFKYCNTWLMTIADECCSDNPDYDHINNLIADYEAEIAAQLRHFYTIEGETRADRRAMREKS